MRVPEWVVLWTLILLWAHGHTSRCEEEEAGEGNWCAFWARGKNSPSKIFQCPLPHDDADNKFCCGSCSLPYCCSVQGDDETQDWCRNLDPWKASFIPTPKPVTPKSIVAEFVLVGGAFVLIAVVVILICEYCRRSRCSRENEAPPEYMEVHSNPQPSDSTSPPKVYDPPPPYEERHPPPHLGSTQQDPSNGSHQEEHHRATARSRRRVLWSDEVAMQSLTTSWVTSDAAATTVDVTPVQGVAGGGEAVATSDAAGGGEVASRVVSFAAPGVITTQPVKRTFRGSSGWYPGMKDYKLRRQGGRGEDSPLSSPWQATYHTPPHTPPSEAQIRRLRGYLSSSLPAHHGKGRAMAGTRRRVHIVHGSEAAATQAPMTSGATSSTSEPATTGEVTPEPGAAAGGGEISLVQVAASSGKATAQGAPAGRGEAASRVVSSAPGVISTELVPMKRTMSGSSRDSWEIKETQV